MKKELTLSSGTTVSINDHRVRVDLPPAPPATSWNALSSAILNGGNHSFPPSSSSSFSNPNPNASTTINSSMHVINYKVPPTYNGYDPPPLELLSNFASNEGMDSKQTVGLLTAASMNTCVTASRCVRGVCVDVIVTAGLSNARAAGAEADYFGLLSECNMDDDSSMTKSSKSTDGNDNDNNINNDSGHDNRSNNNANDEYKIKPGTINTIIIINTPLSPAAMVETYAIAIEAKCRACTNHGVRCAKDATEFAQGTGTDCCVLLSPKLETNQKGKHNNIIQHAGKHCLFAEMVGQAVHEATSEAIMINIRYSHGNYIWYTVKCWLEALLTILKGARPCIPPWPMMPVPRAPIAIVMVGVFFVYLAYIMPFSEKARMLLAAVAWDRYLAEPPVRVHPVVVAGNCISAILARVPDRVFKSPFMGFSCGLVFLVSMLVLFISAGWIFLQSIDVFANCGLRQVGSICSGSCSISLEELVRLMVWISKVLLLKSTFSLQLLCTIALQMAKFLERNQIEEARMQLSWLCSRDPSKLQSAELAAGTLESLSENLSDGFVAPLFWYVVLGPIGALAYRIINTLDSRVGYRGKFEWFGKASARFDDIVNLVPARLTTLLLAMAATLVKGCNARRGLNTAWNDQRKCESPNAGWPMACFAGILGVRLEKPGAYCLGWSGEEPGPRNMRLGHQVAQIAGGMTLFVAIVMIDFC